MGAFHLTLTTTTTTAAIFAISLDCGRCGRNLKWNEFCVVTVRNMEVFIIAQRYRTYKSEFEDSSSSEDEWVLYQREKHKLRSRIPNYINVVNSYMGHEFKSHFRLVNIRNFPDSTEDFSYVAEMFQCLNCVSSHL